MPVLDRLSYDEQSGTRRPRKGSKQQPVLMYRIRLFSLSRLIGKLILLLAKGAK